MSRMFRDQRRSDRAAGTYGRGLSPQEKLALQDRRAGDKLVKVRCEVRNLSPSGKGIFVWVVGEYEGERVDPETGDLLPKEKERCFPNKWVTPAEGGVLIPQWLAEKEGLMPEESDG